MNEKKYTYQTRVRKGMPWSTWTYAMYSTPQEVEKELKARGYKLGVDCRIVEAYTVVRYKEVKL